METLSEISHQPQNKDGLCPGQQPRTATGFPCDHVQVSSASPLYLQNRDHCIAPSQPGVDKCIRHCQVRRY